MQKLIVIFVLNLTTLHFQTSSQICTFCYLLSPLVFLNS